MAAGRVRSTRKLRSWIVEQVSSGRYPGVVWDDESRTTFRIPWKHAGKQDFRKDEDAAIFKAWAEFKGKPTGGGRGSPAAWKTRLRCALNKSPEFREEAARAQPDLSEPYKVYRLVPAGEQGAVVPEKKPRVKAANRRKTRKRRRRSSSSQSESSEVDTPKQIKMEEVVSQSGSAEVLRWSGVQTEEPAPPLPLPPLLAMHRDGLDEFRLDVRIEEIFEAPAEVQDSFDVAVYYLGREVLRRQIQSHDVRIAFPPPSPAPPTPAVLKGRFPRVALPEPPPSLPAGPESQALLTLLPFMEKGVVLTAMRHGVYGKRFCQGRVFWTGPHGAAGGGPHKMERNKEPEMLFSKDAFRQQLDLYRLHGGEPPACSITLCFGEELNAADDPTNKLIIVQIVFPWAEQQLLGVQSLLDSFNVLQSLASESPLREITLNLVAVPMDSETAS
ncbi:interferon regulatory factor 9 isoform X2 [Pseudoliparis swirei]|uniref:interferon regulatory factor 9 isoform X2 n=1 Tax=Pseudoliparis swirei TaxID=2059687 RepID=UPI0024BDD5BD|nr:interferon regulatory factor 9 isoform X2 [Pseudoliparis swirei]